LIVGKFTNGVLLGLGISLLVAPRPGKEMRRLLAERLQTLGSTNALGQSSRQQSPEHLPTTQERVARATQEGMTVPEYVQQTTDNEPSQSTHLSQSAPQVGMDVPSIQSDATRPLRPNQPQRPTP
jgi:gas vesicle protein